MKSLRNWVNRHIWKRGNVGVSDSLYQKCMDEHKNSVEICGKEGMYMNSPYIKGENIVGAKYHYDLKSQYYDTYGKFLGGKQKSRRRRQRRTRRR